jgi:hypothetical protein
MDYSFGFFDVDSEYGYVSVDADKALDAIFDFLEPLFPKEPGKYRVSCHAYLVFDVSDIQMYQWFRGMGWDGDPLFDQEYSFDDCEMTYNEKSSTIDDVKITPIS